jgi:hypothetical protein
MHTACLPPCRVIPLHRPWWRLAIDAALATVAARPAARAPMPDLADPDSWTAAQRAALRHLPPRLLRDIGAPEWVGEDASAAGRAGLDLLRL